MFTPLAGDATTAPRPGIVGPGFIASLGPGMVATPRLRRRSGNSAGRTMGSGRTPSGPGGSAMTNGGSTRTDVLVDTAWLEEHLHDPGLRVVEVDVSPAAYVEGHLPGAVLWNVYQDLKDADYRLVDKAAMERLVERSGIARDAVVVFYGYAPAIGFWLMRLFGHTEARILNEIGRAS